MVIPIDFLNFLHKFIQILEMSVHRGKTDIGNFIQGGQLFQYKAAYGAAVYFMVYFAHNGSLIFNLVYKPLNTHMGNRAFFQRPCYTPFDFYSVKRLPSAALLNYHKLLVFCPLITGKPVTAFTAFPPPPNRVAIGQSPGIYNFVIKVTAMGTTHSSGTSVKMSIYSAIYIAYFLLVLVYHTISCGYKREKAYFIKIKRIFKKRITIQDCPAKIG